MAFIIPRHLTVTVALLAWAGVATANTVVTLGSISQISGPQDLDLEGNIVYAVNFSPDDPARTVSGVQFKPDTQAIAGASFIGPQNVVAWQSKPEFGASADANALEEICHDIRWANAGAGETLKATLAVTPGEEYKLQILISGNHLEDRKWDIRINGQNAVDEITSLGASPGQTYSQNRSTLYAHQFTAPSASAVVEMGTFFGANEGGDRNPIWQALTLERVFIPPTPDDILLDPSQFFANQTAPVGHLSAVDRKSSTVQHAFTLVPGAGDADNAKFTLSGKQLMPQPFDFSNQLPGTAYSIRVRATDASDAARFLEKSFTVAVAAPHSPTAVTLDATSISAAGQVGMTVGHLAATDADAFDSHTFALAPGAGSTDNGLLTVVGNELRFAQLLPAGQTAVQFRVRATDLSGLSTEQAFTLPVVEPRVRINEFLAGNVSGLVDETLQPQDWIEIYNELPQTVDLTGWHLTDNRDLLTKWTFPSRTIGPNGYLIVFADGTTTAPGPTGNLHANFSLDQKGEWFALVKPDGVTIASEMNPPEQFPNVTYGLNPAGTEPGHLVAPTPGAANSALAVHGKNGITFSQPHGFFSAPFQLTLTPDVPGSTIRYTLNGSKPTANTGLVYSGPITVSPDTVGATRGTRLIRALALHPQAAYAPVQSHTYLFINGTGNPAVDGVVTQSTLVASIRNHATYGPLIDDALLALPTVSVISPSGLSTSENEASVELFDPAGQETGFQIDGGLNATGTTSLGSPKLSMAIKFRSQYGQSKLSYPVYAGFPLEPDKAATEFKELRLRSGSHDTFFWLGTRENPPVPYGSPAVTRSGDAQYVRNIWIEEMQLRMGQPGKRGRMVQLYLNGSYHGLYHIQEHPDDDYMASYYPGTAEDYHFTGAATTGSNHGGGDSWTVPWGEMKASLGNYAEAKRWVDMPNLADYMILSFYAGNDWDWSSQHNWSAAGPRLPDRGGWKFFEQDSDICLQDVNANCTDQGVPDGIFGTLRSQHADFRVLFRDRIYKHCFNDGVLTPTQVAALYNARASEIFTALVAETARWQPGSSVGPLPWDRDGEWTVEWNYLKNTYFPQRTAVLLNQFRAAGWYPVDAPVFNQRGGVVPPNFNVTMTAPVGATVYYTTDGSDPRLPGGAIRPGALTLSTATTTTQLFPAGSTWKYLDDGSDQGTAWRTTGFSDGAWKSGPAQLGYGEGDEATAVGFVDTDPVTDGVQKNLTTYFRRTFTAANPAAFTALTVRLKRDDGAVVYLNGQELVRTNLPVGSITSVTPATAADDDGQTFVDFPIAAGAFSLNTGAEANVLAVELHQATPGSSDVSFDLELLGVRLTDPQPLVITGPVVVRTRALNGAEWSPINEASFVLPGTAVASAANFAVTEIHYHPESDPDAEFIEFQNTSADTVDATGVRLSGAVDFSFPLGSILVPGERIVVIKNATAFDALYRDTNSPYYHAGLRVAGAWDGSLANGGESLVVSAADTSDLSTFAYDDGGSWPGRADGAGSSLELVDPSAAPTTAVLKGPFLGTAANWRPSSEFHGSPGWAGTGPDNRVVINEVLSGSILPETDAIELLNATGAPVSIGGWFLSDTSAPYKKYHVPGATTLPAGGYLVLRESDFNDLGNPACLVPFGLNSVAGDDVFLLEADAAGHLLRFVDRAEFGPAPGGLTIGRFPNGTGSLQLLSSPSLGSSNSPPFSDYGAWAASVFPAGTPAVMTDPTADPEFDGLSNLAEFAFGLLPTVADPAPLRPAADLPGEFAFQYPVRSTLNGVSVVVAVSDTLAVWDTTGLQVETLTRIPQGNGTDLITARLKPSAAPRRFVRLEVRM